eukprot:GHRR01033764.1.p1 GENE.GHRR01033764.1~~GHRR01033764.1.p1  ORF type:complete len:114 (+),score=19.17 GHRR01033764.1:248-589(+)
MQLLPSWCRHIIWLMKRRFASWYWLQYGIVALQKGYSTPYTDKTSRPTTLQLVCILSDSSKTVAELPLMLHLRLHITNRAGQHTNLLSRRCCAEVSFSPGIDGFFMIAYLPCC